MNVKIRPLGQFLVVVKDVLPSNVGEIILPEQNTMRPVSGKVMVASPSLQNDYPEGTRVLFGKHAGEVFSVEEGQPLTLLHASEIQAWIPADVDVEGL